MVLTPPSVLDRLRALPEGKRLLAALASRDVPGAGSGRRAPRVEGPLTGVFLVGGAVRDLLLGFEPRELDLLVEGSADRVADELRRRLGGFGRAHSRFGTATISTRDGMRVDVASARAESYARPGALPDVRPGTVSDDMARRDFTVNAIAVGISEDRRGEVHAFPGAEADLSAGVLRVLHDRSFADDPTRLLRLVRYASRLGFSIDPETERLAREAFASGAPETAGVARMGNELMLLLDEPQAIAGLALLRDLGGAADAPAGAERRPDHPPGGTQRRSLLRVEEELLHRALALRPGDARQDLVLLAATARHVDQKRLKAWLAGMHLGRREIGVVAGAAADPEGLAARMQAAERPSDLAKVLRRLPVEAVVLAGAFGAEEPARRWLGELRWVKLGIGGEDLIRAGIPRGPEIGRRLDAALARKLDDGLASRDDELAAALQA
jgi:tRNA nucleotidyltransferase (CCA-adding enzyme)